MKAGAAAAWPRKSACESLNRRSGRSTRRSAASAVRRCRFLILAISKTQRPRKRPRSSRPQKRLWAEREASVVVEFRMPSLGPDMAAGTLVEWLVKPGDWVKRGDIVAVVETQKGAIEIETFQSGQIEKILVELKSKVPVGTPLARIRTDGEEKPAVVAAAPSPVAPVAAVPVAVPAIERPPVAPAARPPITPPPRPAPTGAARVSPAARKLA